MSLKIDSSLFNRQMRKLACVVPADARKVVETEAAPAEDFELPIIIDENLAETLWPEGSAVAETIVWNGTDGPQFRVLGIVQTIRDAIGDARELSDAGRVEMRAVLLALGPELDG